MSHIFDALQRSQEESLDGKPTVHATVTELLERAERHAHLQREAEVTSAQIAAGGRNELDFAAEILLAEESRKKSTGSGEDFRNNGGGVEPFGNFRPLELALSRQNRIVSVTEKESPAAEAFRLLRVRLRHLRRDRPLKRLLITSTSPEEGKSFAAANLACALASGSEEKVLLLEGDLRRPTLSRLFGVRVQSGMCEYLKGAAGLASSIYELREAGIWFLPAGGADEDPLEIIQSPKLPSLLRQLADLFDWIVIDSPPVLPLADTTVLGRLADGILLVARRDVTARRKLKKGIETFDSNKLIGAILNSSKAEDEKDYYYYRQGKLEPEGVTANSE